MKQIFEDIPNRLTDSYYGKKILAAYNAYGSEYGFCRFFSCGGGTVHVYNSSVVIDGDADTEDVCTLIKMTKPLNVEISVGTPLHIDGYDSLHRTLFKAVQGKTDVDFENVTVNSRMKDCYEILAEGFENIGRFEEWYVNMSHRIRHGVSELYYCGDTTVTKSFDIDGFAFLSYIATAEAARGKGGARRLLYCLAEKFEREGKAAYLFAFDHRKSFYEAIGFTPAAEDIYYRIKPERLQGD